MPARYVSCVLSSLFCSVPFLCVLIILGCWKWKIHDWIWEKKRKKRAKVFVIRKNKKQNCNLWGNDIIYTKEKSHTQKCSLETLAVFFPHLTYAIIHVPSTPYRCRKRFDYNKFYNFLFFVFVRSFTFPVTIRCWTIHDISCLIIVDA